MPSRDPDIVVIGSGPNGLVAACVMARRGHQVLVLEANPRRPGGALGSAELTRPGFVHDLGAAFFPFGKSSPAFRELELEKNGLEWRNARFESCHPAPDGSVAAIARDARLAALHFGSPEDARRWWKLVQWHQSIEPDLLEALLSVFPSVGAALRLGLWNLLRLTRVFASSGRSLASRLFSSEAARRVLPSLAMHVDVAPDDRFGAGLGYVLGLTATTGGFAVPRGGAQAITNALVTELERRGGRLRLGAEVTKLHVASGRVAEVELAGGERLPAGRAVLADTSAPALLLRLLDAEHVPGRVVRKMQRFAYGWGTFKVDWAVSGSVPWLEETAHESAVVHAGDSLDDLSRFANEVRSGALPDNPYLVIGQQSLCDDSRAPAGKHTLYCYTRVPSALAGGWDEQREAFADRIEQRIEALAPGFRKKVIARHVATPPDLERVNANLVGGNLGGGSNAWHRQLLFRPVFPYFRYRMPVKGLYLCSSYAHPGAGVHGMCGYNAARVAARDVE